MCYPAVWVAEVVYTPGPRFWWLSIQAFNSVTQTFYNSISLASLEYIGLQPHRCYFQFTVYLLLKRLNRLIRQTTLLSSENISRPLSAGTMPMTKARFNRILSAADVQLPQIWTFQFVSLCHLNYCWRKNAVDYKFLLFLRVEIFQ